MQYLLIFFFHNGEKYKESFNTKKLKKNLIQISRVCEDTDYESGLNFYGIFTVVLRHSF